MPDPKSDVKKLKKSHMSPRSLSQKKMELGDIFHISNSRTFLNSMNYGYSLLLPIQINSATILATVDTGAQCSLISLELLEKILPNWKELPSCEGPTEGVTASGSIFKFLGNKKIPTTIGGVTKEIRYAIAASSSDLLLGLGALNLFKMSLDFQDQGVEVTSMGKSLGVFPIRDSEEDFGHNLDEINASAGWCGAFTAQIQANVPSNRRLLVSAVDNRLIVPVIIDSGDICDQKITLMWKNDSDQNIRIRAKQQKLVYEVLSPEDEVYTAETLPESITVPGPPLKFETQDPRPINALFYRGPGESAVNVASVLLTASIDDLPNDDEDSHPNHAYMGLGIPVPNNKTPAEVVDEELDSKLPTHIRDGIKQIFEEYPATVSMHGWDCGVLSGVDGKPIYLKVPLKARLPYATKYYSLPDADQEALEDIVSYLIHHGLARPADAEAQTGSPAFLVRRGEAQYKSPRVVIDIRAVNKFLACPVATPASDVMSVIESVGAGGDWASSLDLRQAYWSVKMHPDSLEDGVSNVYLKTRTITLLRSPTGLSYLPVFWRLTVAGELDKADDGTWEPLADGITHRAELWYDDLIQCSKGNVEVHLQLIRKTVARFARMQLKINIAKCNFCTDLNQDFLDILGFRLSKNKVSISKPKETKLLETPSPKNVKELQSFLGLLNFLRPLLKPSAIHCATKLSELTSSKREFVWTEVHEKAFQTVKQMIMTQENFIHLPGTKQFRILYTDSSEEMAGGICFFLDSPKDTIIGQRNLLIHDTNERMLKTFKERMGVDERSQIFSPSKGARKPVPIAVQLRDCVEEFVRVLDIQEVPPKADFVSLLVYAVNSNIRNLTRDKNLKEDKIQQILADLQQNEMKSKLLEDIPLVLYLVSAILHRSAFYIEMECDDLLVHHCCERYEDAAAPIVVVSEQGKLHLLMLFADLHLQGHHMKNHVQVTLEEATSPQMIFNYFQKVMASTKASKMVKAQGHFSKSFATNERALPIYQKEALAILYALDHFYHTVQDSKMTILVTDSTSCFFLFSRNVAQTTKKLARYSLKLQLSYPQVRLLVVKSKQQMADFFSRLEVKKQDFFDNSLTPVGLNEEILSKYENRLLSWQDIRDITDQESELIVFSDKKLSGKNIKFYQELDHEPAKIHQLNVHGPFKKLNVFTQFLSRSNIIEKQKEEWDMSEIDQYKHHVVKDGMLFYGNKPMLPLSLMSIVILREHFLNMHGSKKVLKQNVLTLFHVSELKLLDRLIDELTNRCLVCLSVKANLNRKLNYGKFSMINSEHSIQLDFIENLPFQTNLLTIVNVYSRFLTVYVMKKKSTAQVINFLMSYIGSNGRIRFLTSDNASVFNNRSFERFLTRMGIYKVESVPFHSTARSVVEKYNQIIQQGLNTLTFPNSEKWTEYLPFVTNMLNRRRFYKWKISPFELEFGRISDEQELSENRHEQEEVHRTHVGPSVFARRNRANKMFAEEIEKIENMMEKAKETRNANQNKARVETILEHGSFVMIKNRYQAIGTSSKLKLLYEKIPYRIVSHNKGGAYYCSNIVSDVMVRRHYDDLKPIKVTHNLDAEIDVPEEIATLMYSLKVSDLQEHFPFFQEKEQSTARVTRQQRSKESDIEKMELEDLEDFLQDFAEEEARGVSWKD